jgi:molybdopterin/thiamine biosynthesis adenylyltransferase
MKVGVVGLGGTGSAVAQMLTYLGVRRFTFVDYDIVEASNLNRLVGLSRGDIGKAKVSAVSKYLRRLSSDVEVAAVQANLVDEGAAKRLLDCDFLFCCTDSHGSRALMNQLAYQYFIPCVDMGVALNVVAGKLEHVTGRTQLLAPGLGCLTCARTLDPEEVRRDFLTDAQRRADPYIVGAHEPQPAVVSLNATVASLAVTMFMSVVVGVPTTARYQLYNGLQGSVRSIIYDPAPNCIVCSKRGALGKGDSWPLPARSA